jgi:hypothetical protein
MLGAGSNVGLTGDGVPGAVGIIDLLALGEDALPMKLGVLFPDACKTVRSDNELRRFLRGGPIATDSPIVASGEFSKLNAPRIVGRSRDTGRLGEKPPRTSVELERTKAATLDTLPDFSSFFDLLKARQTEPDSSLSSSSRLLVFRVRALSPNFFRSDVFEVKDAEFVARCRLIEASEIEP